MAEKYFAKLEWQWEQKRKTEFGPTLQELFKYQPGLKTKRAKSLRGADFTGELLRLATLTKDTRFQDAVFALFEHDIIDDNFNFLPWEAPDVAQVQKEIELLAFTSIYWVVTARGTPLRRGCAQIAAHLGWPGASFGAAIKDLELGGPRRMTLSRCDRRLTSDSCLISSKIGDRTLHRFV